MSFFMSLNARLREVFILLTLDKVKNYLRIEADVKDDDKFLEILISASEELLYNLTKKVDEDSQKYEDLIFTMNIKPRTYTENQAKLADMYMLALISEMYENRELTSENADRKVRLVYSCILNQLRYGE